MTTSPPFCTLPLTNLVFVDPHVRQRPLTYRDVLDWPYILSPYTGMYWIDCIEMYWIETLYCAYCIGLSPYTVWIETLYWDVLDWLYRDVLDWDIILYIRIESLYCIEMYWIESLYWDVLDCVVILYIRIASLYCMDRDIIMCLLYWIDCMEMYWIETLYCIYGLSHYAVKTDSAKLTPH